MRSWDRGEWKTGSLVPNLNPFLFSPFCLQLKAEGVARAEQERLNKVRTVSERNTEKREEKEKDRVRSRKGQRAWERPDGHLEKAWVDWVCVDARVLPHRISARNSLSCRPSRTARPAWRPSSSPRARSAKNHWQSCLFACLLVFFFFFFFVLVLVIAR